MPKLTIKVGAVQLDYDGATEFTREDMLQLFAAVTSVGAQRSSNGTAAPIENENDEADGSAPGSTDTLTMGEVAHRLEVSSGPDLVVAACAKLTIVDRNPKCARKDILQTCRQATGYYKTTLDNNMHKYLARLCKLNRLAKHGNLDYTLTASTRRELERLLVRPATT